jgi:hypothetical protein
MNMIPMFIANFHEHVSHCLNSVLLIKEFYQPVDAGKMKIIVAAVDDCQQPVEVSLCG